MMKTKLLGAVLALPLLVVAGSVSAGEPVTLTAVQMDRVSAGSASATWAFSGNAFGDILAHVDLSAVGNALKAGPLNLADVTVVGTAIGVDNPTAFASGFFHGDATGKILADTHVTMSTLANAHIPFAHSSQTGSATGVGPYASASIVSTGTAFVGFAP